MRKIYEYKALAFEIKDLDQREGIVSGYGSSFNIKDAVSDIVKPGAFTKTIVEQGPQSAQPRIKYLLNHDVSLPIGKITSLAEDGFGLSYSSKIGTNNAGSDYMKMIDSGLITEHSIGYRTIKAIENSDGSRDLLELALYEISGLSGWGCNQFTPLIGMKNLGDHHLIESRLKRLEKFCRDSDATDETIETLLLEVKQLTQLTIDLRKHDTTKPSENDTKPVVKAIDWEYIATSLLT